MANKIVGTPGDDVLKGTKGKDIIKGKGGNDIIKGKAGNDVLKGGKGDDELKGGKGNDDIKGGKGEDLLIGGKGSDDHWGGGGADIFKFKNGDGFHSNFPVLDLTSSGFQDVVWDFQDDIDKFDVPVPSEPSLGGIDFPDGSIGIVYGFGGNITGSFFLPPNLFSIQEDDFI